MICNELHCAGRVDMNHPIDAPGCAPMFACEKCGALYWNTECVVGNPDDRWFFENSQIVRKDAHGDVIPHGEPSPTFTVAGYLGTAEVPAELIAKRKAGYVF